MIPLELRPFDTLFFRDARPMQAGAGSGGHGANWPLPTIAHESVRTALLRLAGELRPAKTRRGHNQKAIVTEAFRSLRTLGPFPCRGSCIYLPRPSDLVIGALPGTHESSPVLMAPGPAQPGRSDLPAGLRPVMSPVRAGKSPLPAWISAAAFAQSLSGHAPCIHSEPAPPLFATETRIGIAIDPATGSAKDGALFSAEHLRLAPEVSLWMQASLSSRHPGENRGRSIDDLLGLSFGLGGESRMVSAHPSVLRLDIPAPRVDGIRVKWVLATHAVFLGGWRPNWIDQSSLDVQLVSGDLERQAGEDRESHRHRIRRMPRIAARLVALRNEKPIYFSGWDLGEQGPKPTLAAMPAGAVYYFEAASEEDARALVAALHGRTRSDYFGEKGMGLGFCGPWAEAVGNFASTISDDDHTHHS
jgi:CRISPR-associated protein Cmr3